VSWTVTTRPRAEKDLEEAVLWYEKQAPGLGARFITEMRAAIQSLEFNPYKVPVYYREFRRMLLNRFPYKVFYRILDDKVIVFRVLHAKRDHTTLLP
jgi:plasmid stabilization system protein ParE